MPVVGVDHVQLAMPAGREAEARAFYAGLLGIPEIAKPPALAARGGAWFESGRLKVHLGVDRDFRPAQKAHPGLLVTGLEALIERLRAADVEIHRVTLHVGAGTFRPIRSVAIEEHRLDPETAEIPAATAEAVNRARAEGRRVIAVGTTTTRTLEWAADETGRIRAGRGGADLFIYPGYRFRIVDALVTNFHLPRSTLLLLVSAFAGRDRVLGAYRDAVARGYRFYSYGDAMLIL